MVTQEKLKILFNYCSDTGIFTHRKKRQKVVVGTIAGWLDDKGYNTLKIYRKEYRASRMAWLYVYGVLPDKYIDHKNGIRNDDRINNLRLATSAENGFNRKISTRATSGFKGVCFHKQAKKWQASAGPRGHATYLGLFNTPQEAHAAYCAHAKKKYGDFFHA